MVVLLVLLVVVETGLELLVLVVRDGFESLVVEQAAATCVLHSASSSSLCSCLMLIDERWPSLASSLADEGDRCEGGEEPNEGDEGFEKPVPFCIIESVGTKAE